MKRIISILIVSSSLFSLMAYTAILKKDSNIRISPSLDSSVLEVMKKGENITVIRKVDGLNWYKTEKGYISYELLGNIMQNSVDFDAIAVTNVNVNVRVKPSLKAKIKKVQKRATEVKILRKITNPDGQWYETSSGYMFADLLAVTSVNKPTGISIKADSSEVKIDKEQNISTDKKKDNRIERLIKRVKRKLL